MFSLLKNILGLTSQDHTKQSQTAPPGTKSTQSPLLNLPGELRNRIYELALSSPTPLRYDYATRIIKASNPYNKAHILLAPRSPSGPLIEFNQLKYVCRQLYAETAGLEIKFNRIAIKLTPGTEPKTLFEHWRASMSVARRAWIDRADIVLEDWVDWWDVCGFD